MYLSDFVMLDGERYYVAVDTRTCTIRLERASSDAIAQFMHNILFPREQRVTPKKGGAA